MKRILTATVLIIAVVALVLYGQPWMITIFSAIVACLAAYEYIQLAEAVGSPIPLWWMAASVALFFLIVYKFPQETITAVSAGTLILLASGRTFILLAAAK